MTNQTTSTWRKWDLHVHTPESHLNQDFNGNFDSYFKTLFNTAIENDIAAIGPTDYFTIDGYKKIRQYLNDSAKLNALFDSDLGKIKKIKQILVLPNIELRLNFLVNNNKAVFHIIFSDQLAIDDIERNFLHKLSFINTVAPANRRNLTTDNLMALGKQLTNDTSLSTGSYLKIAMANISLDLADICEVLNSQPSIFKGHYLFCTPCYDDITSVDWLVPANKLRKDLIENCNFIFASDKKTVAWSLAEMSKPSLHGCDAHIDSDIFRPCTNKQLPCHSCVENKNDCVLKFCQLNTDLTFEGLKSALNKPAEKIKI